MQFFRGDQLVKTHPADMAALDLARVVIMVLPDPEFRSRAIRPYSGLTLVS